MIRRPLTLPAAWGGLGIAGTAAMQPLMNGIEHLPLVHDAGAGLDVQRQRQEAEEKVAQVTASSPPSQHLHQLAVQSFADGVTDQPLQAGRDVPAVSSRRLVELDTGGGNRQGGTVDYYLRHNFVEPVPHGGDQGDLTIISFQAAIRDIPLEILHCVQLQNYYSFFTLGIKICSGSSTSWMKWSSSRVGGR